MAFALSHARRMVLRNALMTSCLALAACATPPVQRPDYLLHDEFFAAPAEPIGVQDVFRMSDEMRRYAAEKIAPLQHRKGRNRGLFEALYRKDRLQLEYDSAVTRNAAQAFAARAGNCLSLVIMTAAFAKELGVDYRYQVALHEAVWSRSNDLYVRNGHVNLTVGAREMDPDRQGFDPALTIDFIAPEELRGLRVRPISEATVVAMFMNNRATESLIDGRLDDAYAWARAAIDSDPAFLKTYNTLGVIYHRHDDLALAERAFRYVLAHEPTNAATLSNLAQLERRLGHAAEAEALEHRLARVESNPPFHFFNLGMQAMQRGDYRAARDLFTREIDRDPYYHEFRFWLAVADFRLGDVQSAQERLALAVQNSTTHHDRDLYAAKLAWLRARRP